MHEPALTLGADGVEWVGIKRNKLLALAKGEAIACFDDDNIYAETYLETMLGHLWGSGAALVGIGAYYTAAVDGGAVRARGWTNSLTAAS